MADEIRKLKHTAAELDEAIEMLLEVYTRDEINGFLASKIDKEPGKGLSTNDFMDADKSKLDSLENYDDTVIKSEAALNRSTLGYQRKNLLKNTAVSQTKNGVTFTVNEDGSVTANGTATSNAIFTLSEIALTAGKKYTLSGCPEGGSSAAFKLYGLDTTNWAGEGSDYGNGDTFTNRRSPAQYRIAIYAGYTADNLTFYPMLRYAEITDDTYEPYKLSVEERLAALEAAVLGGGT